MAEEQQENQTKPVPPNGCRWCGIEAQVHFRRWKPPAGWHQWEAPTNEQRKERMIARRLQQESKSGEYQALSLRPTL
ncbi:hypothetical protein [Microtetraspora malaysiensis]|uniref:hypothetical protein n=1 Tax=Microtetraspora malaysiensis TaxID=161358 RepID=UPI003D8EE230